MVRLFDTHKLRKTEELSGRLWILPQWKRAGSIKSVK